MSDKKYPISGSVWFRESTQEWVLELEGSINGTYFIDRHTEPSTTLPEDVPGLPSLYHAADRIEALITERDEAQALQSCACSYDTPTDLCLGHHLLFDRLYAVQRGKLEAKLEHAKKGLRKIIRTSDMHSAWDIAIATLEKLKGEKHD